MQIQNPHLAMPAGLDEKGQKAHAIIVEYLVANNLTTTELQAFYGPVEWRQHGEYGCESHLVVMYDGATSLKRVFSSEGDATYLYTPDCYKHNEAMQKKLAEVGLYFQECTRYYGAVYEI